MAHDATETPRVLEVDLDALERGHAPRVRPFGSDDPALARIGSWGGTALGLAELADRARERPAASPPLVFAVGDGVRRGLPTAARLSVLSRAPLAGLLAEGQVGGDAGVRLAAIADALVLSGRTERAGAVLVLGAGGRAELQERPELVGRAPADTCAALAGEGAVLCIGPGGERGLPFANLASGGGGDEPRPSFVGRGGLGAVLGRSGLKAIVLAAQPPATPDDDARAAILTALRASPRLAARAAGGTMELFGAFAARGDLRARNYSAPLPAEDGRRLVEEARARGRSREGCRGCPTPCGWVFERTDGMRMGARFGATYALGTNLGLTSLDDALALLAACDRAGLDAKEVGALLALAALAQERGLLPGPPDWGERERLAGRIAALVGENAGGNGGATVASMRAGAAAFARSLGLEREHAASGGMSARPEADHATVLGQCTSVAGADPMRSFPFLLGSGDRAVLERLYGEPLPPGAEDPGRPTAKGRLVAWHEDLVAAVDACGFCAFSTAGLLGDGICDLDRLAGWILPPALRAPADGGWSARPPGARLLAMGANLVLLRREIHRRWDAPRHPDRPEWARAQLDEPGMLDEYTIVRDLDADGLPRARTRALLGSAELGRRAPLASSAAQAETPPARAIRAGVATIELRAFGGLGDALGGSAFVEVALPATAADVLRGAVARDRALEHRLFHEGRPVPAIWRAGRLLAPEDEVATGDVLDLVVAIGGG